MSPESHRLFRVITPAYLQKLASHASWSVTGRIDFDLEVDFWSSPSTMQRNSARRASWDNSPISTNSPNKIHFTSLMGTVGSVTPIENFLGSPYTALDAASTGWSIFNLSPVVPEAPATHWFLVVPMLPLHEHQPCPDLQEQHVVPSRMPVSWPCATLGTLLLIIALLCTCPTNQYRITYKIHGVQYHVPTLAHQRLQSPCSPHNHPEYWEAICSSYHTPTLSRALLT